MLCWVAVDSGTELFRLAFATSVAIRIRKQFNWISIYVMLACVCLCVVWSYVSNARAYWLCVNVPIKCIAVTYHDASAGAGAGADCFVPLLPIAHSVKSNII